LLRVLEEGSFERLGSTNTLHVNVRIIAATNRDLGEEVKAGRFRKRPLLQAQCVSHCNPAPPERPEDIPLLVWRLSKRLKKGLGKRLRLFQRNNGSPGILFMAGQRQRA